MTRHLPLAVAVASTLLEILGCAPGPVASTSTPGPHGASTAPLLSPDEVQVFQPGQGAPEQCMRLISVSVGGNPFARVDELQEAVREKAADLGTTHVFLLPQDEERAIVTAGREGARLQQRETGPELFVRMCRHLPVHLGIQISGTWEVERVFAGTQAEAAGLRAGDQIVILNQRHSFTDPAAWDRILARARPGDRVDLEFLDGRGNLQRRALELFPSECLSGSRLTDHC